MKRKSLTMILCLLTCLSLVGVGFAAWVITAPAEDEVTGNIEVDTVTDKRLTVSIDYAEADKTSIVFGNKTYTDSESLRNYGWLQVTADSKKENLEVSFIITVTANDTTWKLTHDELNLSVESTVEENAGLTAALNAKYVTVTEGALTPEELPDSNATDNVVQYKVTYSCNWGTALNVTNPYQFFNSQEYSETLGDSAYTILSAIKAIEGSTYNLTVSVTANNA